MPSTLKFFFITDFLPSPKIFSRFYPSPTSMKCSYLIKKMAINKSTDKGNNQMIELPYFSNLHESENGNPREVE